MFDVVYYHLRPRRDLTAMDYPRPRSPRPPVIDLAQIALAALYDSTTAQRRHQVTLQWSPGHVSNPRAGRSVSSAAAHGSHRSTPCLNAELYQEWSDAAPLDHRARRPCNLPPVLATAYVHSPVPAAWIIACWP